jgi:methylenetetrahydrofolate reductase (NADPH)
VTLSGAPSSSQFRQAIQQGEFLLTAEITPPKGADTSTMLTLAQELKGRVHAINLTDSNRAMARMSPLAASVLLQQVGIEPIFQLACRDRNRLALQGDLLGGAALGLRNVLALTGDPIKVGDCVDARAVFDLESVRLLQLIQRLNNGLDCNGKPLPDGGTDWLAGAAVEPQCGSFSGLERRFNRKLEHGAEFFQSQMVTDFEQLERFMDKLGRPGGKPILAGIFLLKSAKNAQFINRNLPGVKIPEALIQRLAKAPHPLDEGIRIAAEQVQQARQICQGVHLMAVKAEHLIPRILDEAGIPALR